MTYPCSELLVSHLILIQSQWINQVLISSSTIKYLGSLDSAKASRILTETHNSM